jgi:hypothetical protein
MLSFRLLAEVSLVALCAACTTSQYTPGTDLPEPPKEIDADVSVEPSTVLSIVAAEGFGLHSSVYDNSLQDPTLPGLLDAVGISILRYPGGGYSDNYHWSTHTLVPSYGNSPLGYLADGSDFGSYVSLLDSFQGTAMITVDYGSNPAANGPGEPKEAAAWVAYANGSPDDSSVIGLDSVGTDWHTVGYWAGLRAAAKLPADDGQNFLRIAHPAPVGIQYWEIGNELFGNGYYDSAHEYEEDLHAPYDGTPREHDARLSPSTYGAGVNAFIQAMKAVDPSIQVGAVLNTPPLDYSWGPDWDQDVLAACGMNIDFAIIHWYPSSTAAGLMQAAEREVPNMFAALSSLFAAVGPRATPIQVAVTEMGPAPGIQISSQQGQMLGVFVTEGYLSMFEHGVFNVDFLELHKGGFLSSPGERKGPAYKAIQMMHELAKPGDALVSTTSSTPEIAVHAATRADGSLGVMLVNTSATANVTVTATLDGDVRFSSVKRFDYTPSSGASDGSIQGPTDASDLASPFTIRVPLYSIALLEFEP